MINQASKQITMKRALRRQKDAGVGNACYRPMSTGLPSRWSWALAVAPGAFRRCWHPNLVRGVIGLDPSEKMIDQARLKPVTSPVVFGRASARELPLPHGCVDLVFIS